MSTSPSNAFSATQPNPRRLSVVVADNCAFVRFAIINELRRHADVDLMGEAATGADTLRIVRDLHPDVLVLDIQMPDVTIADIAARLQALTHPPRMLVVTASADMPSILTMLSAGATGYLLKDESPAAIAAAVRLVAQGLYCLSAAATQQMIIYAASRDALPAVATPQPDPESGGRKQSQSLLAAGLNAREMDVLRLTVAGYTNQEIAKTLAISKGTVQNRVSDLYHKVGVSSRTELVAWAWKHGMVHHT